VAISAMPKEKMALEVARSVLGVAPRLSRADGTHNALGVSAVLRGHVRDQLCLAHVGTTIAVLVHVALAVRTRILGGRATNDSWWGV